MDIKIQSQYTGTNIETLIKGLNGLYREYLSRPVEEFQRDIYDLDTANTVGLDLWGVMLNFPRVIKGVSENETHTLEDDQYRIIMKLLAIQMNTRLTIPEINRYLETIFGMYGVKAFCVDKQDMTAVNYVFVWEIPEWIRAAFTNYNLLPTPMGVGTDYREAFFNYFGFKHQELMNFYMTIYHEPVECRFGFEGQELCNFHRTKFYNAEV